MNNAGFGIPVAAVDESLEEFRSIMEVNLVGLFDLARSAARVMIEGDGGSIINRLVHPRLGRVDAHSLGRLLPRRREP